MRKNFKAHAIACRQTKKKPSTFQLGHRLRIQPAMRLGKVKTFFATKVVIFQYLVGTLS